MRKRRPGNAYDESSLMDVVQLGHAMKGVFMSACVPVRSMKNTAEFAELVERERDVTVTKNGCEFFHCLSDEQYLLCGTRWRERGCSPELCDPNRSWKRGLTALRRFGRRSEEEYGL